MSESTVHLLDDEAFLLLEAARGSRSAYAVLYRFYLPKLYRYIHLQLRSKEDAEEVLQDIFLKLWENRAELVKIKSLNSYLFTMTRNRLLNIFDHSKVEQKAHSYFATHAVASTSDVEEVLIYKQYEDILQSALRLLPPKRRKVFEMSMIQEMSHDEIAKMMQISKSIVKKQLYAANRQVKEYLHVHAGITAAIAMVTILL